MTGLRMPSPLSAPPLSPSGGGVMSTRRTRFSPLKAMAAVLLACLAFLFSTTLTSGQSSARVYVSNMGQTAHSANQAVVNAGRPYAQPFDTGSISGGYPLGSIAIVPAPNTVPSDLVVTIRAADSNDLPSSTVLATLTNPASITSGTEALFAAPSNTTLAANTTYFVHFDAGPSTTFNVKRLPDDTTTVDSGGATGWSIGELHVFFDQTSMFGASSNAASIQLEVRGDPVSFSDLQTGHTSPIGMWSPDGSTLWVGQWFSTQVYAYNLADETANYSENWTLHNPATVSESNRKPTGIWSNGTHIYVTDPDHDRVFQYNAGDKSLTPTTYSLHTDNGNRQGLWSDGTTAWVSDNADDKLYAYQLSDFSRQSGKDIDLHSDNGEARGIWSDGATIWVLDRDDEKIYAYLLSDGSRDSGLDIDLDGAGENYNSIWSDGTTMYVVENTSGSATRAPQIHKLPLPAQDETVVWNATLTSADSWSFGSVYTYDGYASSAFGSSIQTTQGSLSPDSVHRRHDHPHRSTAWG